MPRVAARRMPEPVYRGSYAWRYAPPAYENEAGPYRRAYAPRMAGWGGLAGGRTSRIAQAQAAGYIVMRSRTYEYPDGTQFRSYRPLGYEDLD